MSEPASLAAAVDAHAAADDDGALRHALALLAGDPEHLMAAALSAQLLHAEGRPLPGVTHRLVSGFLARGDFPAAVYAARATGAAADDADLRAVAAAFARDAVAGAAAPPPLPSRADAPAPGAPPALTGAALRDAAEDALTNLVELGGPAGPPPPSTRRPLFSELDAASLAALLARFRPRAAAAGEDVVVEGEPGEEAYLVVRGRLAVRRGDEAIASLGPGAVFGELALVAETPRGATVTAAEGTLLLAVDRDALQALDDPEVTGAWVRFTHARLVENLVRSSRFFEPLEPEDVHALASHFQTRTHEAGDTLVRAGEEGQGLHLVASGRLRVVGVDAGGDEVELAEVGPGAVVGEMALVLRRPVGADVVALTPVVALELSRDAFEEAVRAHPTLLRDLYQVASERDEITRSVLAAQLDDAVLL